MALADSPVISDQDSLIEQEPIEKPEDHSDENHEFSTFTRKRPVYLSNSMQRKQRKSLMSPQSIPNLDEDDVMTPDFAMTQSMYEPLEKRKQQEKMEENSRLLKLIASEKSSQAAKERKIKEMKKKALENKKRNEEKQKLFEERRQKMLADQEAKKNKILKKISIPNQASPTEISNMSKSVTRYKIIMGSGFMEKRPISSTGKIFGFGSSAPRDVCESFYSRKNSCSLDRKKSEQPISRMCASQIVHSNIARSESKPRIVPKENTPKPMSSSIVNISSYNRALIKKKKAVSNFERDPSSSEQKRSRRPKPETPEPRSPRSAVSKSPFASTNQKPTDKPRARSTEKMKSNHTPAEPRSRTTDISRATAMQAISERTPIKIEHKPKPKIQKKKPKPKKELETITISVPSREKSPNKRLSPASPIKTIEQPKKFEVRFEEKDNLKDEDSNLISESSISIDRPRSSTSNLTEDEYKQRIAMQRKLAKEKRRKEQEEKERRQQEEELLSQVKREDSTSSNELKQNTEIVNESGIDSSTSSDPVIREPEKPIAPSVQVTLSEVDQNNTTCLNMPTNETLTTIELPKGENPTEMTASTEALDRIERKRRIDSIMSRIKKPIGGSSENVTHHMSSTTLQDMLNKGHLSGMSKTAAILMKNSHQTPDISASAFELHNPDEIKSVFSPIEQNSKSQDILVSPDNTEESRGLCDGQEDLVTSVNVQESLATKSNLMENLVSTPTKPYLSSWAEKYSDSYSIDNEDE